MNFGIECAICRQQGMGPYWQTMFVIVDEINGDIIAFNTNHKLATVAK